MSLISEAHREDPKPRAPVETSRRGIAVVAHTVEVMMVDSANRSGGAVPLDGAGRPRPAAGSGFRSSRGPGRPPHKMLLVMGECPPKAAFSRSLNWFPNKNT